MSESFRISLKAARVNAGKTMDETCAAVNVSKTTLSNWENGITVPSADKAAELADYYGVRLEHINFCRKN